MPDTLIMTVPDSCNGRIVSYLLIPVQHFYHCIRCGRKDRYTNPGDKITICTVIVLNLMIQSVIVLIGERNIITVCIQYLPDRGSL